MKWLPGWAYPSTSLASLAGMTSQFPVTGSWSLGSFQSMEAAMKNPVSIPALILVGSTARFCATDGYDCGLPEANLRAMQRALTRDPRGTLESFHRLCAGPATLSAGELAQRVEQSLSLGLDSLAAGLRELREKDLRDDVTTIECPVLLLHGEEDRVIPVAAARRLAARLPRAKLVTMPGAGHDLPIRHADRVAEQISKFVGGLS